MLLCFVFDRGVVGSSYGRETEIPSALVDSLSSLVKEGGLPSLQAAVVYRGRASESMVFGSGSGMDHMCLIGSVQKVVTATAVLQLHERGLLDIDDDVNSHLPFPVRHPKHPSTPITIRMLLAHRSGMEMFRNQVEWDTRFLDYGRDTPYVLNAPVLMSRDEFIKESLDPEGVNFDSSAWRFEPDITFWYSNSAYLLLCCLIEEVSGMPYRDYLRENVFEPLGMRNTRFYTDDTAVNYAVPHTRRNGENIKLPVWTGDRDMLWSTAEDMAKFMKAHIDSGRCGSYRLLKPETIALMRDKHSRGRSILHPMSNCPTAGYGLGIEQYSGEWFGHGGSTIGFQCLWRFNAENGNGYVLLTNVNGLIHGPKNFDAVWATVSAAAKVLKSELDTPDRTVAIIIAAVLLLTGAACLARRRYRRQADLS